MPDWSSQTEYRRVAPANAGHLMHQHLPNLPQKTLVRMVRPLPTFSGVSIGKLTGTRKTIHSPIYENHPGPVAIQSASAVPAKAARSSDAHSAERDQFSPGAFHPRLMGHLARTAGSSRIEYLGVLGVLGVLGPVGVLKPGMIDKRFQVFRDEAILIEFLGGFSGLPIGFRADFREA